MMISDQVLLESCNLLQYLLKNPVQYLLKLRIAVVIVAIATHPVVLYYVNDGLGWEEVQQILILPITGWLPPFAFYLFALRSRLAVLLGSGVILVGYPMNIAIVNSEMDESSTAALGFVAIPNWIILPSLIFIAILDAFIKWTISNWKSSRNQPTTFTPRG
ncbi:hypothetical protein [Candidatus Poriferisocius sp.]|uniref:hypothetical protein n=1 Tax=Candidatus Poriferisocius sp. TaxID=3101276 RepID=UPI003B025D0C